MKKWIKLIVNYGYGSEKPEYVKVWFKDTKDKKLVKSTIRAYVEDRYDTDPHMYRGFDYKFVNKPPIAILREQLEDAKTNHLNAAMHLAEAKNELDKLYPLK